MRRLRHPIRAIREPFGTAGLVVACLALVLATTGAALAAGGLTKSQEKQVAKIAQKEAKKYAGKPGAQGPAGSTGVKGDTGAAGKDGTNGSNGSPGASGVSVTGKAVTGGACGTGVAGVAYTSASGVNTVCNGKNGKNGTPEEFPETLPGGKTETGAWAFGLLPPGTELPVDTAISFPIRLASELAESQVHFVKIHETAPSPGCTGGTVTAPVADPGNLCVYEGGGGIFGSSFRIFDPTTESEDSGAGATGAVIQLSGAGETASDWGTWAVTAEEE